MGNNTFRYLKDKLYGNEMQDKRILILGLDAAGKTTLLYRMKLGECVQTIPSIGFNVGSIAHGKLHITAWDVGGRDKIRPLIRHYYSGTNALIYIIDSNDKERVGECKEELQRLLSDDELRCVPLLIMANKQDLPNAMSTLEVTDALDLHSIKNREWYIQGCCTANGDGVLDGFDWLHSVLTGIAIMKQAFVKPVAETAESVTKTQGALASLYNSITNNY